ncbi:MAG: chromate efflux transporter [Candidatus Rokuibacteriota bacterium]|nr:MAG: chromate efflux transporter [Candidatus Rokubacteria bacterium]
MPGEPASERVPIRDLVRYYLRLGVLGFGGPVALVGQMERELVDEKKWLTKEEMREGIAVCQSLPGPLAIQVGIWISYIRGGFWGAWAGGWAFILPNFIIVVALGALYVRFEGLPAVAAIFYGVSPAVIALILHSCYRLTKLGMKDWLEWTLAAAAFIITVAVQAEVALVFIGCGIVGLLYYGSFVRGRKMSTTSLMVGVPLVAAGVPQANLGAMLGKLLAFFLKAGSLTFGSGLVIVPFLEKGLVQQTGANRWLPSGWSLGLARLDDRHLPALVPAHPDRCADPASLSAEPERAGLHQGRLRRRHRHDSRRVRPARENCDRGLADRARGPRESHRAVPLEGEQSCAGRRDGDRRSHRVPTAQAGMGVREVGGDRHDTSSLGAVRVSPRLGEEPHRGRALPKAGRRAWCRGGCCLGWHGT